VSHLDADKSAMSQGTTEQYPTQKNGTPYPRLGT
jgi:hypothetical protein